MANPTPAGGRTSVTVLDYHFEVNEDGHLIVTADHIKKALKRTYDKIIVGRGYTRLSNPLDVGQALNDMDTDFFDFALRKGSYSHHRYVYKPNLVETTGPWVAGEVNYIGVGMGFRYFTFSMQSKSLAHAITHVRNLDKYQAAPSPGKKYWLDVGFNLSLIFIKEWEAAR